MHSAKAPPRRFGPVRRIVLAGSALVAGMALALWLDSQAVEDRDAAGPAPRARSGASEPSLADLAAGRLAIIDLGWPLNAQSGHWPGDNYRPFELHTLATLEKDGVLSKAFASPEHLGTHLDAPNHFEPDGNSVDQIPPGRLFAPGVLLDISPAVSGDPDYLLSLDDVHRHEARYGPIPDGALVLAFTGWSQFWPNQTRYINRDVLGKLHFPGFSSEAVEFLIEHRHIRGVGLDTLSVDQGLSRDFPVHHLLGKAQCYGLENLARLDELPARGFYLIVAPMKIETGSGAPARVFAVLSRAPDTKEAAAARAEDRPARHPGETR